MEIVSYIVLIFLGLCLGSFAGATIWRLRARQLIDDKKEGYDVDKVELKALRPLTERSMKDDRSQCLHCGHTLAWYDLVPLVSWASTGGKCRYCKKPIGYFEPAIELMMASIFLALFIWWPIMIAGPMTIVMTALWFGAAVLLVMLFYYDLRWFILPNVVVFPLIAVSAIARFVEILHQTTVSAALLNTVGAVMILSGLYWLLYLYSRSRFGEENTWVGFGDVKLGIALGLLLGSWQLAFIGLFIANLLGVVVLFPSMISKQVKMNTRVPLGPLLIAGFFIALFFGTHTLDWYQSLMLSYPT